MRFGRHDTLLTISVLLTAIFLPAPVGSWSGTPVVEFGSFGVIPSNNARKDQLFETLSVGYEANVWSRHSIGVMGRALAYHDPHHTIWGGMFSVSDRIWLHASTYQGYYLLVRGSILYTDKKFIENDALFNFSSELHFGYVWKNNFYLQAGVQHISNGYTKRPNTGINSLGISLGYFPSFFTAR